MAVVQMDHFQLCAMQNDRKKILELLQRRGCVEVTNRQVEDSIFTKKDTTETYNTFVRNAELVAKAAQIINKLSPIEKPMLAFLQGREVINKEELAVIESMQENILNEAEQILQWDRDVAEAKAENLRLEMELEALDPWLKLPFEQDFKGTKKTAVIMGTLSGTRTVEDILLGLATVYPQLSAVHLEVISTSTLQTVFYVIVPKKYAKETEEALRVMGFTRPANISESVPAQTKKQLEEKIASNKENITKCESSIKDKAELYSTFLKIEDYFKMRAEKQEVVSRLVHSKHAFVLDGYLTENNSEAIRKELEEKFNVAVDIYPSGWDNTQAPVLLKNNAFARPAESILSSYSLPGIMDIDPTNVLSIFYYIVFGIMFSDAGYGFIMALACAVCLKRFKNMEENWRNSLLLFFWCGVSTVIWGIVFSSYFGDVVNVVSGLFFGREISIPPLWISPLEEPILMLLFSLAIGLAHLTAGYMLKMATCLRNKQPMDAIWDGALPIILIYPLIVVLMGTEMFFGLAGFKLSLSSTITNVCFAVSGACMVGVLLTGGRESKSWGKRLLKGIYALYNVLAGWLGDILSYSRLLALGLATGVIASVMNRLGAMLGGGITGAIIFTIVFLVGQTLNFGINVLGAYVHSNRLTFVEFLGKFYEGGGRAFEPFGIHTKHYKIEEDVKDV